MAQILLIKDANTIYKDVDDLVVIKDDGHKWSDREKEAYTIRKILGFKSVELQAWLKSNKWIETTIAFKAKTLQWSLDEPEMHKIWKDYDGKWYFYNWRVKCLYTFKNMLPEQWEVLESPTATRLQKEMALSGVKAKIRLRPENLTEVTEINNPVRPV